ANAEETVKRVIMEHVECGENDWRNIDFASLGLKSEVVSNSILRANGVFSNRDLTNTINAEGLIKSLSPRKFDANIENDFDETDGVERMFIELKDQLPPNVYWKDSWKKDDDTTETVQSTMNAESQSSLETPPVAEIQKSSSATAQSAGV
ncbi:hypothetical protein HK098_004918, partial [Nowakowskiella sp. JEL0407]